MTDPGELLKRVYKVVEGESNSDVTRLASTLILGCITTASPSKRIALTLLSGIFLSLHEALDNEFDEVRRRAEAEAERMSKAEH